MEPISRRVLEEIRDKTPWGVADVGYALPTGSLNFLDACIRGFGFKRIFEFGSGASTKHFLEADCEVTTIENDPHWLEQTIGQVPEALRSRLHVECQPLERIWTGGIPCRGWHLSKVMQARLAEADLVLVDSPAYPPFREAAVMQALRLSKARLLVLDDVRIPTLRRFCDRIASQSTGLEFVSIDRDHTLGAFIRHQAGTVANRPSVIEWLKGWRRYVAAGR